MKPSKIPHFEKWIEAVSVEDTVADVARYSLSVRLAMVIYYLPLAAQKSDEDVEYVHQLRVAARRSMAALRLYSQLLPKKHRKRLHKSLRRVIRSAGKARDLDVLAHGCGIESGKSTAALRKGVRRQRDIAQKPIVAINKQLGRKGKRGFEHSIKQALGKEFPESSTVAESSFGQWARLRLQNILKRFVKASPSGIHDLEGLHRFRILGKELRYTLELLASAFPPKLLAEIYATVEELQTRLGDIHDHTVAIERLQTWIAEANGKKSATHLRKRLEKEQSALARDVCSFGKWWSPNAAARFRKKVRRMLS